MRRAIIDRGATRAAAARRAAPGQRALDEGRAAVRRPGDVLPRAIEFDIAHATITGAPPTQVAAHYSGADISLVHTCWILMLAMVTAWRCEPGDDLPNGRAMAMDWIRQLRAALQP